MADYELYVFDYNYSSWSMRAGVLLRATGLPFREQRLNLDDETRANIDRISPSRLLPLLVHGELRIWDSLAIGEYLAEQCPEQPLWPRDAHARAIARAASAEMHSGFSALRGAMPMNIRAFYPKFPRTLDVERNVRRIEALWGELRARFGRGGPYLFGEFGIVDAMFAPIVMRFRTYDVKLEGACADYAAALLQHGAVQGWLDEAQRDTYRVPAYDFLVDS
jgi:glutathione S-transferase